MRAPSIAESPCDLPSWLHAARTQLVMTRSERPKELHRGDKRQQAADQPQNVHQPEVRSMDPFSYDTNRMQDPDKSEHTTFPLYHHPLAGTAL